MTFNAATLVCCSSRVLIFLIVFFTATSTYARILECPPQYNDAEFVQKTKPKVVDLLKRANDGDAQAQYSIGKMLFSSEKDDLVYKVDLWNGIDKKNEGMKYIRESADNGFASAESWLGYGYLDGRHGLPKDPVAAEEWLTKAAKHGIFGPPYTLAYLYSNGSKGIKNDPAKVAYWWRIDADQGDRYGERELVNIYADGSGVQKNYEDSVFWFLVYTLNVPEVNDDKPDSEFWREVAQEQVIAAQHFNSEAQSPSTIRPKFSNDFEDYNLEKEMSLYSDLMKSRTLFDNGDAAAAIKILRTDAENGFGPAQVSLGDAYFSGKGVKQDYNKAFSWYLKASSHIGVVVGPKLGFMYARGLGVKQDYNEATYWFMKRTCCPVERHEEMALLPQKLSPQQTGELLKRLIEWKPIRTFNPEYEEWEKNIVNKCMNPMVPD